MIEVNHKMNTTSLILKRRKLFCKSTNKQDNMNVIQPNKTTARSEIQFLKCDKMRRQKLVILNKEYVGKRRTRGSLEELVKIFIFAYLIANFSQIIQIKPAEAGSKSSKASSKTTVIAIDGGGGGGKPHPVPVPWPIVHCHHHHHHLKYVPKPVLVHHWVKKEKPYEIAASVENPQVSMLSQPPNMQQLSQQQSSIDFGSQMSPHTQYQVFGPGNELSLPVSSSDTSKLPYEILSNSFDDGHPLMSGSQPPSYTHFKTSFSSPGQTSSFTPSSSMAKMPTQLASEELVDRQFKKVYEKQYHHARPQVSQKQLEKLSQTILANASAAHKQKQKLLAAGEQSTLADEDLNASIKNIALANKTLEASTSGEKALADLDQHEPAGPEVDVATYPANDLNKENSNARPSHPFVGGSDLLDQYKDESMRTLYTLPIDKLNLREESEAMKIFNRLTQDQSSRLTALNRGSSMPQFNMMHPHSHPQQQQHRQQQPIPGSLRMGQPEVGLQPQQQQLNQQPPVTAAAAAAAAKLLAAQLVSPAISARVAGAMSESHTIELMTKLAEQMAQVEARKLINRQQQQQSSSSSSRQIQNNGTRSGGKLMGNEQPTRQSFIQKVNLLTKLGSSLKSDKDKRRMSQSGLPISASDDHLSIATAASVPILSFQLPPPQQYQRPLNVTIATGGAHPSFNMQQQQLLRQNLLSRAASSRFISDAISRATTPIAPIPLNLGLRPASQNGVQGQLINNNNQRNSSISAQASTRVNEFASLNPNPTTTMSSEQETSFYSGQQEHLAKLKLRSPIGNSGTVSSRFGGIAQVVPGGVTSYRAQSSNIHDSVVIPNEPLTSTASNLTLTNEQQQQQRGLQYETSGSPLDATGSQYMLAQAPLDQMGQHQTLFNHQQQQQQQNWQDFARQQATNEAIAAAMQHSQQYLQPQLGPEEVPANYVNQPSMPMSTYLEFPMSPQQWSSEALKSMNQEASNQQPNQSSDSVRSQTSGDAGEDSGRDNNDSTTPTSGEAPNTISQAQNDINSQFEIVNYDPNSGKSFYEQMETVPQPGGPLQTGNGNGQYALSTEQLQSFNPMLQQQQSLHHFSQHHQNPSILLRSPPPYSANPWIYNQIFNGGFNGDQQQQQLQQSEGSIRSNIMTASPSMNPMVISTAGGQQITIPAGRFQSAGYLGNNNNNNLLQPALMQPVNLAGSPTLIMTGGNMRNTKNLAKASGLLTGGSALNPIGQTLGPAANNLTSLAGFTSGLRNQMGAFQQRLPQMPNIPQPPQMPNLPMPPPGMMQMAGLALPFAMARATRNSNRIRNQQVNAAANSGGTTAGQRFILSATQLANRFNRSRRKPTTSPGDPLRGASSTHNRWQHPNRRPMMRFFQTVVDMTRNPPKRPKVHTTASRIATVAALTGGVSKIKPKADDSSSLLSMVARQQQQVATRNGRHSRSLILNSLSPMQRGWRNASAYLPGSLPVTITDGRIDQFSSMTSPVDLLARQIESNNRHRRQLQGNMLMREYPVNSYDRSSAGRSNLPLPIVANHINLLMFTAQNVTGDLLRSQQRGQNLQQEIMTNNTNSREEQEQQPNQQEQQAQLAAGPSEAIDDTSGYVIEPEAFIRTSTPTQEGPAMRQTQTRNMAQNVDSAKGSEHVETVQGGGQQVVGGESNIFRAPDSEVARPEFRLDPQQQEQAAEISPPTFAPQSDANIQVEEDPFITTRLPMATSTFEGYLPSQLMPTTTTSTTTSTTTTSTTPAPQYPTTLRFSTPSRHPFLMMDRRKQLNNKGSGKSRRSTKKPQEIFGPVDHYQMAESRRSQFTPIIPMTITLNNDFAHQNSTKSTTSRPIIQTPIPKVNPTARSSALTFEPEPRVHKSSKTSKTMTNNSRQQSEVTPNQISEDYVRAIKLVRGVAFPWPPPTKSSKAFGNLLTGSTETAVLVV